jgi:hypothetical protein
LGRGEVHIGFCRRNLRERDHLEDPDVDGRIILRWIFRKRDGRMDWIDMDEDRDRWWALLTR